MGTVLEVRVEESDIVEYEKERLARISKFAQDAPLACRYDWTPPKLKDDGSYADESLREGGGKAQ